MKRTADQLLMLIQQICIMDLAYLGESDSIRKTLMYDYLSLAMQAMAKQANNVAISEPLIISGDGPKQFKAGGAPIADMFQPLRMIDSMNVEARHSQSFTFPKGWYWEGSQSDIYVRGLSGTYTLHYIKYPAWITSGDQIPDFPPSGYMALIYECAALIKQSKNFYEESNAMKEQARSGYGAIEEASKLGGV